MTLKGKIILRGKGLHSGSECEVVIEPYNAPEIILRSEGSEMPLSKFILSGTNRGSDYIYPGGTRIRTCEHVLSALTGMGIFSGVRLTVTGGEMPALDGCSHILCDEIIRNSLPFKESPDTISITEPVIIYGNDMKRFIAAFPCDKLQITYTVEYKYVGTQIIDYEHSPEAYYREISRARTFAMLSDIEYLRSHGMAMGGSLENAIVIGKTIRASGGLHWPDEFVRHKVLDLIGDLAAVCHPIKAHIIAMRAGHELHLKLSEKLRGELKS